MRYWFLRQLACEGLAMVKSSTKIQNEHLVCYVSTLHLKEIAYFSDILCRNYVSLYESGGFVCLLHMATPSPLLQTGTLLKKHVWYRGKVFLTFGKGFVASSPPKHPLARLLHKTLTSCSVLCCSELFCIRVKKELSASVLF